MPRRWFKAGDSFLQREAKKLYPANWKEHWKEDCVILACETLKDELFLVMERKRCVIPVVWAESRLHSNPELLNARLAELLRALDPKYKTVLLVFGVCGNALVGLEAHGRTLVMPLVPDCIPLLFGSNEKRLGLGTDTYFFTEGYLRGGKNILAEQEHYVRRYGEKRARRLVKAMMHSYRRFAVIDTGAFDVQKTFEQICPAAALLEIPIIRLKGNLRLIEDLLDGNWDRERFLVTPPNEKITFEDSLKTLSTLQI